MFTKVFLFVAFTTLASAYQIPYQGLDVPVYEKSQYDTYHSYPELIKYGVGYPYYQGYYKYPYYTPEEETGYVTPETEYPYYPYVSSWLKNYPYYLKYFQQYYQYPIGKDIPYKYPYYYGKSFGYYPYSYGSSPLWSKILGGGYYGLGGQYYTGVPQYPVF